MKKVSGTLKLDLAQYRSMQAFAMFASDLDEVSRRQLVRGARLMELLRQPQYTPYPVEEQVVSIWAGTKGHLDDLEVSQVLDFEERFIDHLRRQTNVLDSIRDTGKLEDDTVSALQTAVESVKRDFTAGQNNASGSVQAGNEEATPVNDADVDQEQIVKR